MTAVLPARGPPSRAVEAVASRATLPPRNTSDKWLVAPTSIATDFHAQQVPAMIVFAIITAARVSTTIDAALADRVAAEERADHHPAGRVGADGARVDAVDEGVEDDIGTITSVASVVGSVSHRSAPKSHATRQAAAQRGAGFCGWAAAALAMSVIRGVGRRSPHRSRYCSDPIPRGVHVTQPVTHSNAAAVATPPSAQSSPNVPPTHPHDTQKVTVDSGPWEMGGLQSRDMV
jgi:hypothetical protein